MPRAVAPPPSGEFQVKLSKPFAGQYRTDRRRRKKRKTEFLRVLILPSFPSVGEPKLTIEVLGEPNRSAVIRQTHYTGNNKSSEKTGDVSSCVVPAFQQNTALLNPIHPSIHLTQINVYSSSDDVNELLKLVQELRGFPSSASKDIYGADVKVDFNTFDIQWSNDEEEASEGDVEKEQKDDFKRIADSIEALARQFATNDSAI